jgi:hypothetical protein
MVMVILPAARRHHRSRTFYAFGLLALLGALTTLAVVARYPALSPTELAVPVPAPEITVIDGDSPGEDLLVEEFPAGEPGPGSNTPGDRAVPAGEGAGTGADPLGGTGRDRGAPTAGWDATSRSLFWSGVLGLAISLAGLGLVGTRRRMW